MADAPISIVANVQISLQALGINQAGFGVPNILTDETPLQSWGAELIRSYSDATEVLEDWLSSDDAYKAAVAIFSQTPRVPIVKISREGTRVAQVQTIVFSGPLITLNTIAMNVDGVALTATPFNTTNAQTLTDLAAKIQATASVATAASNGTDTITVTSVVGLESLLSTPIVTLGVSQATAVVTQTVAVVGVADFLADISEQDDAWYGLIWVERNELLVATCAEYIETQRKIFITCSSDADVTDGADTDDIGSTLMLAAYTRSAVSFNATPTDYLDAGWMGRLFPYDPGSETFALKTVASITPDDLTTAQRTAALTKNVNIYVIIAGQNKTLWGTMASGLFIDLRRGSDWLQAQIEEGIFLKLGDALKVPFTQRGINIVEEVVRAKLENGIRAGLLSNDPFDAANGIMEPYLVTFPKIGEISTQNKADRILPNGTFQAKFAGAIHQVSILNGTISV